MLPTEIANRFDEPEAVAAQPALEPRVAIRRTGILMRACSFLLLLAAVAAVQLWSGSYRGEFAAHPDEPAHYVTGLMMRDYAASLFPAPPIRFAEQYYLHYPKVAIGHWPPVFYLVQGAWVLAFSETRISVLLLMAVITAACAMSLGAVVARSFGLGGMAAALMFVSLPVVQKYECMVMADTLVALFCFQAAVAFGRFLDASRARDAVQFGVYASLAILTKGNAFALALLPAFAIVLARRPALLRSRWLWASAAIVAAVCGPWQLYTMEMVRNGWVRDPGIDFTLDAIGRYASLLWRNTGFGILGLAIAGTVATLLDAFRAPGKLRGSAVAALALCGSVAVFNCLVPATIEDRLLLPLILPMLVLAAIGAAWMARSLGRLLPAPLHVRAGLVVCAVALLFAHATYSQPVIRPLGFGEAARAILANPRLRDALILVSSEQNGEGALTAEMAMLETRPGHIILRGTKVLAHSRWDGRQYQRVFESPEQIRDFITEVPIQVLVLDTTPGPELEHHRQLLKMVDDHPGDWSLLGSFPKLQDAAEGPVRVYALLGHEGRGRKKIRVDLNPMVDRVVEK